MYPIIISHSSVEVVQVGGKFFAEMFCTVCGKPTTAESKFCSHCGKDIQGHSGVLPSGRFGRVKSFIEYKASSGRPNKANLGKAREDSDIEVVIGTGLMHWDPDEEILKEKRGKRLSVRVPKSANYKMLLEIVADKWKHYRSNLFEEGKEYVLLLEDCQEGQFLPGPKKEFFTLQRYKEELLKDYKRITLFLCTSEDLALKELEGAVAGDSKEELGVKRKRVNDDGVTSWTYVGDTVENGVLPLADGAVSGSIHKDTRQSVPSNANEVSVPGNVVQSLPSNANQVYPPGDVVQGAGLPADPAIDFDVVVEQPVCLRRSFLRDDMIKLFGDPAILNFNLDVTLIGNDGKAEAGRGVGVVREALSSFWQLVFNSLTEGTQEKVPCIRHDHQKLQWEAVARIIVYGMLKNNYFPITLSRAVIASVMFGEESISDNFLLESFKLYVSAEECETINSALGDNCNPEDEELLEFLGNYKCYIKPTKENISRVIHELAHQELIKKPRYIADCFSPILDVLRAFPAFQTLDGLLEMYEQKKPTPRKVVKLLEANPASEQEKVCLDHLKRYIRSLNGQAITQFVTFLTGSNVISCDSIQVTFSELEGLARRPIARTCGPILELPSTYSCYTELAEDFNALLNEKGAWTFNIA